MDQITTQALDMIFENDTLKNRVKQKVAPYVIGGLLFNVILLSLIVYMLIKLNNIQGVLASSS